MKVASPFPPVAISDRKMQSILCEAIDSHTKHDPGAIAFICAEEPESFITFKQLGQQSHSIASYLNSIGFGHLDVAAVFLPNRIEYGVLMIGIWRCGGIFTGVSFASTHFELKRQLLDSGASVLITDETNLHTAMKAIGECKSLKQVICIRETDKPLHIGIVDYNNVISHRGNIKDDYNFSPHDTALLPYSSGTTGVPKGVMLTHQNFGTMMEFFRQYTTARFLPAMDNAKSWRGQYDYLFLPFYHLYGFGMLYQAILKGTTSIVPKKFNPQNMMMSIQRYKIKCLLLVPPVVLYLTKSSETNKYDLSSIRILLTSAAPIGKDLSEEFLVKFPKARIANAYGMTEAGMGVTAALIEDGKRNECEFVGHIYSIFEFKAVDLSTGVEVPPRTRGELCIRGPTVMKGYLNRPDATKETIDEEGWLHTGDIAMIEPDGMVKIVDRKKELIKVKGLQVAPAELEDLLQSHSEIADAAVVGVKEEKAGEKPMAFVVKKTDKLTERDVQKYVEERLSPYKWLTGGVKFVEQIPKSPSGKILRRLLRDQVNLPQTSSKI
ncbi:hypothetical protein WR25_00779 [Diploscapter pachys]|uniref:AMP-dependent synthetase/ligase domain-containing protein n=1 Tax=Diploscapter pachys TaxID=2018661 RepID=A0A2A2KIB6_9BILA|nr:hypothetical protein WR25_00779 [Diploscapter pachys]